MRVLHLVTNTRGGAGIAATRLHLALLEFGQDSILLSRNKSDIQNSVVCETFPIQNLQSKAITFLLQLFTNKPYSLVTPFSLKTLRYQQIKRINPEVIHIHNWYNLINLKMIHKLTKNYRVVLTLHDSRIYTGGCHYTHACRGYLSNCAKCPAIRLGKFAVMKSKKDILNLSKLNISLIFPSDWLRRIYNVVYPKSNCAIEVIPNVISGSPVTSKKNFYDIKSWNVTFISASLDNPTKGLKLLMDSLEHSELNSPRNKLTLIGKRGNEEIFSDKLLLEVAYTGSIGEDEISSVLNETHILVTPSTTDNLPSVIGEGQSHGCIVMGTRVGGIPELVQDGINGFLCEPNTKDITETLNRILHSGNLEEISKNAIKSSNIKQKTESIVFRHIEIYNA